MMLVQKAVMRIILTLINPISSTLDDAFLDSASDAFGLS